MNVSRCEATSKDAKRGETSTASGRNSFDGKSATSTQGRNFGDGRGASTASGRSSFGGRSNTTYIGRNSSFGSLKNSQVGNDRNGDSRGSNIGNRLIAQAHSNVAEDSVEVDSDTYCVLCEKPHSLTACPDFLVFSVDERSEYCKNKNLCFKCTKPGHQARACSSKIKCNQCGGNHHGLFHGSKPPFPNRAAATFVPNQVNFAAAVTNPTAAAPSQDCA